MALAPYNLSVPFVAGQALTPEAIIFINDLVAEVNALRAVLEAQGTVNITVGPDTYKVVHEGTV